MTAKMVIPSQSRPLTRGAAAAARSTLSFSNTNGHSVIPAKTTTMMKYFRLWCLNFYVPSAHESATLSIEFAKSEITILNSSRAKE